MNGHVRGRGHPRSILFISALDLWSMGDRQGAPSLWMTLKGYAERDWQVYFITGNKPQGAVYDVHPNIYIYRFDARWLKTLIGFRKVGFFTKAFWWGYFQVRALIIAQQIHKKNCVNFVYGYETFGVPVAKLLSLLWRIPVISRFQGSILRLVWMKKPFWRLRAWEYVIAYKISIFTDLVIMTNDGSQGDRLLRVMGVEGHKVRFWMNGVEKRFAEVLPKETARGELNLHNRYVLLYVARLMALKRVDRAIQILPDVLKSIPDVMLVVIGDGPEGEGLGQLVQRLGVAEHVRFEGAVSHDEIPNYLAAADVFLSFYDWSNVGNPLLEAMMAGKCLVTLNNGDTGQFVRDGDNGVLLEDEDLPHLPQVIGELLVDEERRRRLGNNARKFAEEHFWTWEERMEQEIAAVESLVTRDRRNG
jgi:glycosyltransferase involved in cell wall biosynthesis